MPTQPPLDWLRCELGRPVSARNLGLFRIGFGLCLLYFQLSMMARGRMQAVYINPPFLFHYPGFEWLPRLSPPVMHGIDWMLAACALMLALGIFYRLSAGLFMLGWGYIFLLEQSQYNNHYYLVGLLALLFWVSDAHRWGALGGRRGTIPAWQLYLFRFQILAVYFLGGLAKLEPNWLLGTPMRETIALGPALGIGEEGLAWLVSYAGIFLDLFAAPCLLWRPTRPWAMAILSLFHLANSQLFDIDIFPALMLCTMVLFLDAPPQSGPSVPLSRPGLLLLGLYVAIQLAVPACKLGGDTWSQGGHYFCWRLMLRSLEGHTTFLVRDPETAQEWWVNPGSELIPVQLSIFYEEPIAVVQYARRLKARWQAQGHPAVQVFARVWVSQNYRRSRYLVDPEVDLGQATWPWLARPGWITPDPGPPVGIDPTPAALGLGLLAQGLAWLSLMASLRRPQRSLWIVLNLVLQGWLAAWAVLGGPALAALAWATATVGVAIAARLSWRERAPGPCLVALVVETAVSLQLYLSLTWLR